MLNRIRTREGPAWREPLRLVLATVLVNALILGPGWIQLRSIGSTWLAFEAPLLVGLAALIPGRMARRAGAVAVALLAVTLGILALGDAVARESLARPLNLYLDLHLVSAILNLLRGTLGEWTARMVTLGVVVCSLLILLSLAWLIAPVRGPGVAWSRRGVALLLVGLGAAGATARNEARATEAAPPGLGLLRERGALPALTLLRQQHALWGRMRSEEARFAEELATSPSSHAGVPGLLRRLDGRDVILAFIESYGVTVIEDPRYAPVLLPRLAELDERMREAGIHLVTGSLESPTQGGQSWLAHGSVLSGLWLDNQLRYDLFLTSGRENLVHDFRHAGYRTAVVMPQITLPWPEGELFEYDRIFAFKDIGYRGPPLNWVTMPDQFTWSFLQNTARADPDPRPAFIEVGLISSHAPWTPILTVLDDWDSIGDGSVFAPWEGAGETPVDLWRDHDRVREHFALSVDYAVHAMTGYAERYLDDRTLLVVMGDHQPAPMITGEGASRAVPVHVLSRDPELLRPFVEWGFIPGAVPSPGPAAARMDEFRGWFVGAFSGAP